MMNPIDMFANEVGNIIANKYPGTWGLFKK